MSDPVEERDILKLLAALEDPRVQDKIAEMFVIVSRDDKSFSHIIPKRNIIF